MEWTILQKVVVLRHSECTVNKRELHTILIETFNTLGMTFLLFTSLTARK
jgi:hypothetical protein